jgi:hypothetical protein
MLSLFLGFVWIDKMKWYIMVLSGIPLFGFFKNEWNGVITVEPKIHLAM